MLKLGLFVQGGGHHVAAWRHPSTPFGATQSFAHFKQVAQLAERSLFDMIFFADALGSFGPDDVEVWQRGAAVSRLEPVTLMAALSAVTERIGLVATMSTTYQEPFHIARFFATLDRISNGRAGWNLVTSAAPSEPHNFGRTTHPPAAERYERASECAKVVLGLWNTWDDDAFIEDRAEGLYFDAAKMRYLNHEGEYYKVRGPLNVRRSAQGHPVLVQAGQSEPGKALAGETAEVVFTVQQELEVAKAFRAELRTRAQAAGRDPDAIKIMPGLVPVVAETRQQAQAKFDELQNLIHSELGLKVLSDLVGLDLRKFPIDGPMPDAPPNRMQEGRQRVVLDMAKHEGLTIRQVYQRVAGARGHRILIGSPRDIADDFERWHGEGAADGFNLMPPTFPTGLRDFIDLVVPELQRRGLFRTAYEGDTLRKNLGLPFPHVKRPESRAAE